MKTENAERKLTTVKIGNKTVEYESCTGEEWEKESEYTREFINFGDGEGYEYARRVR